MNIGLELLTIPPNFESDCTHNNLFLLFIIIGEMNFFIKKTPTNEWKLISARPVDTAESDCHYLQIAMDHHR